LCKSTINSVIVNLRQQAELSRTSAELDSLLAGSKTLKGYTLLGNNLSCLCKNILFTSLGAVVVVSIHFVLFFAHYFINNLSVQLTTANHITCTQAVLFLSALSLAGGEMILFMLSSATDLTTA